MGIFVYKIKSQEQGKREFIPTESAGCSGDIAPPEAVIMTCVAGESIAWGGARQRAESV